MKSFLSLLFVSSLLLASCKKEVAIPTTPANIVPFTEVGNQMKSQSATQQTGENTTTNPVSTAPGMNPAHGQPGHQCGIAVGAPLNTPAISNNEQTVSIPTSTVTITPNPGQATPTAKGMNPAHGQPGHQCGIAVGAPLNGSSVANKQQSTVTPATTVTSTSTPVNVAPTAEGKNPAHGQPGHKCDIAVGEPLPKG